MFKLSLLMFCMVSSRVFAMDDLPPEVKQMLQNLHTNCVQESGTTEDAINAAKVGKFNGEEPLKCYMKCLMTSIGVMEDDGAVDGDAYVDLVPDKYKPYAQKVIDNCKPEGSTPCEIAYNMNLCMYNLDPAQYMLY